MTWSCAERSGFVYFRIRDRMLKLHLWLVSEPTCNYLKELILSGDLEFSVPGSVREAKPGKWKIHSRWLNPCNIKPFLMGNLNCGRFSQNQLKYEHSQIVGKRMSLLSWRWNLTGYYSRQTQAVFKMRIQYFCHSTFLLNLTVAYGSMSG